MLVSSSEGGVNHLTGLITFTRSNNIGAATVTPVSPGLPSPSAFPAQTPITYSGVVPTAQASRNPKLVPVFQARLGEEEKYYQPDSPSGLLTFLSASYVSHMAEADIGGMVSLVVSFSSFSLFTRTGM